MSKIRVLSEDGAIRFVEKLKEWCKAMFALINHTHTAATQSSAGFISAADKTKLDGLSKITVDSSLSSTSTNPVQNKVINNALSNKSDITHTHSYAGSSTSGGAATSANKLNTNAGSSTTPVYFTNGVPAACTSVNASYATSAESATTATKLGTSTVGTSTKPIYLNAGTATASTSTVGTSTKPIYLSSGTLTASSSTIGSSTKPVYLSSGTLTASSSTVGSTSTPVYLNSGTITACTSITATTASKLGTSTVGSGTKPIYLSSGSPTASTSTVGDSTTPVYLNSGTITKCSGVLCKEGMPMTTSTAYDPYVSVKKLLYNSTSGTYSKVECYLTLTTSGRHNWITIYYGSPSGTRRLSAKVYLGEVTSSTTTRYIPLSFMTVQSSALLFFASQWTCTVTSAGYMTLSCTVNKTFNHGTIAATNSNEVYIYRVEGEGAS